MLSVIRSNACFRNLNIAQRTQDVIERGPRREEESQNIRDIHDSHLERPDEPATDIQTDDKRDD